MPAAKQSAMFDSDPARVHLLLQVLRIVFHNLLFRLGGYTESKFTSTLCVRPEVQTALHPAAITHSVVELYASTRRETVAYICENKVSRSSSLSMVSEF